MNVVGNAPTADLVDLTVFSLNILALYVNYVVSTKHAWNALQVPM